MFGDDFFGGGIDDLFRRLSGGEGAVEYSTVGSDGKRRTTRRTQKDVFGRALLDKVSTKKNIYFIFDYAGKDDVYANVSDELVTNDYSEKVATGNKVLQVKSGETVLSEYPLSDKIRTKGFESNFKNGILEVSFRK
jgi:hypothetical protein